MGLLRGTKARGKNKQWKERKKPRIKNNDSGVLSKAKK
jgi:hypothetical protein